MAKQLEMFVEPAQREPHPVLRPFIEALQRPGLHRARKRAGPVDDPRVAYCPNCGRYVKVD